MVPPVPGVDPVSWAETLWSVVMWTSQLTWAGGSAAAALGLAVASDDAAAWSAEAFWLDDAGDDDRAVVSALARPAPPTEMARLANMASVRIRRICPPKAWIVGLALLSTHATGAADRNKGRISTTFGGG